MNHQGRIDSDKPTIFARLSAKGIDYVEIKKLVSFHLPHARLYQERHFGSHTPPQIVAHTERWRKLLDSDFILLKEQKEPIEQMLSMWELFAWRALVEGSFPRLGEWKTSCRWLPTHHDPEPRYIYPAIEVHAVHQKTHEKRRTIIPGDPSVSLADAWRKAFTELGLLKLVLKRDRRPRLVSARHSQGWPIFTKMVIPRLYEFMLPYYRKRGNVWSQKERNLKRNAYFPKELLEEMREVLQIEHPDAFPTITLNQLKSTIQRHRARQPKVLNPQKGPKSKK